jgi:uncharacterized protein YfdQ (DUF2303 family)
MDLTQEAIELLLKTGRAQNEAHTGDDGIRYFIKPDGNPVSLAGMYKPQWIRQRVQFEDCESFAKYFNRFKNADSTIFASVEDTEAEFTAILDYHGAEAHRGDHVTTYRTLSTPEWKAWQSANRKHMAQIEFATWLEDNSHLFVAPPGETNAPSGADLLELVKSLHGHQNASFNTALRLDNGAYSVKYEESIDVRGTIKADSLTLPPFIYGGFPLFQGMPGYLVKARLKTRIENRKLVLFFETVAVEKTVRDCIDMIVDRIEEKTEQTILMGAPVA